MPERTMTFTEIGWRTTPPARRDLCVEAIHVWRVRLDEARHDVGEMQDLLTDDEAGRARRFRFEADRRRFTVARGTLRRVLGYYLDVNPRVVAFHLGRHGKPSLSVPDSDIRFNVAHSADMALIAVSRGRELGVDVEYVRPLAMNERIAEQFFAPRETHVLRSLPLGSQESAFFACWTRKEAYLKARGEGLSFDLNRFEVSLAPADPAALHRVLDEPAESARWAMVDLRPAPGYIGALVAERGDWLLGFHEWAGLT